MSAYAISGAVVAVGSVDANGREEHDGVFVEPVRIVLPPFRPAELSYTYEKLPGV